MERSRSLSEVLSDVLILQGAILEKKNDDSLEYLLPSSLSQILGIPEHGKLSFTYFPSDEETINASYDSELLRSLEKGFSRKGRWARARYFPHLPNIDKLSKGVVEKIVLSNATFRLKEVQIRSVTYFAASFKYVALSDERREGLFSLLANELNGSVQPLTDDLISIFEEFKESDQNSRQPGEEDVKALRAASKAASILVQEELYPFIHSLEKRLNRDIRRIFDYYEALKSETRKAMEDHLEKNGQGEKRLPEKLDAIDAEKEWKVRDLISKYAMNVRIEPVSAIGIETETPVFWININRRLSSKLFPVTFNPLNRRMDPLPCEACFYPRGGYYICDDKLHIICSSCFKKCPQCGRQYCSACHRQGCPRCGKDLKLNSP
jgi:hypothetical protein